MYRGYKRVIVLGRDGRLPLSYRRATGVNDRKLLHVTDIDIIIYYR